MFLIKYLINFLIRILKYYFYICGMKETKLSPSKKRISDRREAVKKEYSYTREIGGSITLMANSLSKKLKVSTVTIFADLKSFLKWVDYPSEDCPVCKSNEAEVRTKSSKDNIIYDNEKARCKKCGHTGYVVVEDSECADVVWDEVND